jgi:hypothetical protein
MKTAHLFFADAPLSNPQPLETETPYRHAAQADPLIDHGGQGAIYIGLALLALIIFVTIGVISRRIEYAILTALSLTLLLVGLFLFIQP